MRDGDFANIPAGTPYATEVTSGHARWVFSSTNGDGLSYWTTLGTETESHAFAAGDTTAFDAAALKDVDVTAA